MRKIKRGVLMITLILVTLLSGCGSKYAIPKDWVYMSYEEAIELYNAVDFTVDNINDYFSIKESKDEIYNEWDELESVVYKTVWGLGTSNYVKFDTPEDEFLMDYTYTYRSQTLKLDPNTLEVIEVLNENTLEKSDTFNDNPFQGIVMSYYKVDYEKDGSLKLNENGELIVTKTSKENVKIERIRGHVEWIQDIPEKYMMDTDTYSRSEGMLQDSYVRFFAIESDDYYFTYECYEHDSNNDFQTKAFETNGSGYRGTGRCISFVRGFED